MILKLDDNYRIVSDERNFILQRKAKEATDRWKNLGYWKDLSQLLDSYTGQVLRTEIGKTTLKALSRDLLSLTQAIERIGEQCVTLWGKN